MNVMILHERARAFEARSESPWLSLKCMVRGEARYRVGRREYTVGHGECLMLNEGSPYEITIAAPQPVESFVVFFSPDWVAGSWRARREADGRLLDDPIGDAAGGRFDETLQPLSGRLAVMHHQLRAFSNAASDEQEEVAADLLDACVSREMGHRRAADGLDAKRPAVRRELQRRLQVARDYLVSNPARRMKLDDVARVAALSPFHLSRQFKKLFGAAPMAYLREVRMQRALALLRDEGTTVLEACVAVGFESPTTFSALMKRRWGVGPRELRRGR